MLRSTEIADALRIVEQAHRPLAFLAESGFLLLYRGRARDALSVFEALTDIAPNDPTPCLGRAEALWRLQEFDAARESMIEARRRPHAGFHTLVYAYALECQFLVDRGMLDEARATLDELAALAPEHVYLEELGALIAAARLAKERVA
jgi:tetratricopeptide (TPR) repeat protein